MSRRKSSRGTVAEKGDGRPRYEHSGASAPSQPPRPGGGSRHGPQREYSGAHPDTDLPLIPGEVLYGEEPVVINEGRPVTRLEVRNTADRPIQVGSHYHFFEVNPGLEFDRDAAWGLRLNVISGGSVRFEPGAVEEVELVPLAGERMVAGLRGAVGGKLDG